MSGGSRLSHLNDQGEAHMVDVGGKAVTARSAVAEGRIFLSEEALSLVLEGRAKKGDVLAAARLAGIMAAKRTGDLIPLCHPLPLENVTVEIEPEIDSETGVKTGRPALKVTAEARISAKTGVEMEALTAVSIACLTIYDMVKAADKTMTIEGIRLLSKSGGRSGDYRAQGAS